jgi:hypothetical protein
MKFPDKLFVAVMQDGIFAAAKPEEVFDIVDDEYHLPVMIVEYRKKSKPVKVTRKFELS